MAIITITCKVCGSSLRTVHDIQAAFDFDKKHAETCPPPEPQDGAA